MFLSGNKKNNVYSCKLQFYYIKVGFKGVKIIKVCFYDDTVNILKFWALHLVSFGLNFYTVYAVVS